MVLRHGGDEPRNRIERVWEKQVRRYQCPQPDCRSPIGRPCVQHDNPGHTSDYSCTGRYRLALADGLVPAQPGINL